MLTLHGRKRVFLHIHETLTTTLMRAAFFERHKSLLKSLTRNTYVS